MVGRGRKGRTEGEGEKVGKGRSYCLIMKRNAS